MLIYTHIVLLNDNTLDKNNNWFNLFSMIGQFFSLLFIFLIVVALAYFTTKWIASSKYYSLKKSSNIQLVESLSIGFNCHLQIIKAADTYVLIALNKDKITHITNLNKDYIEKNLELKNETANKSNMNFESILNIFSKSKRDE